MILILILKNAVKITDWLDFLSDTKSEKKNKEYSEELLWKLQSVVVVLALELELIL